MRLDVYYLFLEKTGITKDRTLLDTSCIKKPTVQDYLDFVGNHNKTYAANSGVVLGPAANGFLSSQGHFVDIDVASLATKMSTLQVPV
ncbi:uncharacterized protein N7506_000173 [Penicillium brevicompactum]|uniref:uncharacterized protein n=1 Tax=Penicillium brevicompactum TaxID=5074 RepID=UPI0025403B3B|nr:uncharacterized protein N7506_000173 [Penicillium brevicompactum]KAJ5346920.1 hypothetical protein N7506_000173 [Penicillium brevicompactum]